jgi:hypothetical protein
MQIGLKVVTYSSPLHTAWRSIPRPDNAHCRPLRPAAGSGPLRSSRQCSHLANFEIRTFKRKKGN